MSLSPWYLTSGHDSMEETVVCKFYTENSQWCWCREGQRGQSHLLLHSTDVWWFHNTRHCAGPCMRQCEAYNHYHHHHHHHHHVLTVINTNFKAPNCFQWRQHFPDATQACSNPLSIPQVDCPLLPLHSHKTTKLPQCILTQTWNSLSPTWLTTGPWMRHFIQPTVCCDSTGVSQVWYGMACSDCDISQPTSLNIANQHSYPGDENAFVGLVKRVSKLICRSTTNAHS